MVSKIGWNANELIFFSIAWSSSVQFIDDNRNPRDKDAKEKKFLVEIYVRRTVTAAWLFYSWQNFALMIIMELWTKFSLLA